MPTTEQLYDEADKLKDAGQLEEAAAKLNELLATAPDYALAHSALAVIYTRLRKHDEAVKHAVRTSELEPNDAFSFTARECDVPTGRQDTRSRRRHGPRG